MDTKVNYAIIGAFVITLTAAIIFSIIWLSSGFSNQTYATYQVDMQEAVTGLNREATVEYNGVNVGSVQSIKLNKQNPKSVELLLSINSDTPVTQGTVATLSTRGVTGISYISLKDNGNDLRPLKALQNQKYPIIKTAPSIFLQLDTALQKITFSMKQVSETFKQLFDNENLLSIKQILVNTNMITYSIAANNAKINAILKNTELATARFPLLLQSSTRTMQTLQTQTIPDANRMIANLNHMLDNLTLLTSELQQNPSVLIRGKEPPPLGPGEK